jgi:hypothetical protein
LSSLYLVLVLFQNTTGSAGDLAAGGVLFSSDNHTGGKTAGATYLYDRYVRRI